MNELKRMFNMVVMSGHAVSLIAPSPSQRLEGKHGEVIQPVAERDEDKILRDDRTTRQK